MEYDRSCHIGDGDWAIHDAGLDIVERLWAARHKKAELSSVMATLDEREQYIIRKRFMDGWALSEVGDELGITKERVRQVQNEALGKMRRRMGGK